MNKQISTRVGLITSFIILAFLLFLIKAGVPNDSPYILFQFLILFVGILVSIFILYRYYAGIQFIESFSHGLRTLATTVVIVILGNVIIYFIFRQADNPLSNLTFLIMKIIFSYSAAGVLSSLISSLIFNTFTKK